MVAIVCRIRTAQINVVLNLVLRPASAGAATEERERTGFCPDKSPGKSQKLYVALDYIL